MTILKISNPFNAPVYHEETVTSTMDISRRLASDGEPHGTVITADFQEAGRGRIRDRNWRMEEKSGLPFTILLRYPRAEGIPPALTLRVGLAVSIAIEDFAPSLKGKVMVKWPNDIMIHSKKVSGILCEADGGTVHTGIGINFSQKEFPASIREKATSIALASGIDLTPVERFSLIEKILARLFDELEEVKLDDEKWKSRLERRLYKKDENVVFIEGAAGSGREVRGRLAGITGSGELLIIPNGEIRPRSFITGELTFL
jgi:BirA family biotin operon repressor/biotin-[acetyl-CoA-carboxylase] ligase